MSRRFFFFIEVLSITVFSDFATYTYASHSNPCAGLLDSEIVASEKMLDVVDSSNRGMKPANATSKMYDVELTRDKNNKPILIVTPHYPGKTIKIAVDPGLLKFPLRDSQGKEVMGSSGNQKSSIEVGPTEVIKNAEGAVVAFFDFRPSYKTVNTRKLASQFIQKNPTDVAEKLQDRNFIIAFLTKNKIPPSKIADVKFIDRFTAKVTELQADPFAGLPQITDTIEAEPLPPPDIPENYVGNLIERVKQGAGTLLDIVNGILLVGRDPRRNCGPYLKPESEASEGNKRISAALSMLDWATKHYFVESLEQAREITFNLWVADPETGRMRPDQNSNGVFYVVTHEERAKLLELSNGDATNFFTQNTRPGGFYFDNDMRMHKMSPATIQKYYNPSELGILVVNGERILYSRGKRFPHEIGLFVYQDYRNKPVYQHWRKKAGELTNMGLILRVNNLRAHDAFNSNVTQQHERGVATRFAIEEKSFVDDKDNELGRIITIDSGQRNYFLELEKKGHLITFEAWHQLPDGKKELIGFYIGSVYGELVELETIYYKKHEYRKRSPQLQHPIALYNHDAIEIMRALKWPIVEYLHSIGIDVSNAGMLTANAEASGGQYYRWQDRVPVLWELAHRPELNLRLPKVINITEQVEQSKKMDIPKKPLEKSQNANPLNGWKKKMRAAQELENRGMSVEFNSGEVTSRDLPRILLESRWNRHTEVFEGVNKNHGFIAVEVRYNSPDSGGTSHPKLVALLAGYGDDAGKYKLESFYDTTLDSNIEPTKLAQLAQWALADRLHQLGITFNIKGNDIMILENLPQTVEIHGRWQMPKIEQQE